MDIATKCNSTKSSFGYNARMRYVYNTSGPYSMARFLRLPANALILQGMRYCSCNHFKDAATLAASERRMLDVITNESNRYFSKGHRIHVGVGDGTAPLPELPVTVRMHVKSRARRMACVSARLPAKAGEEPTVPPTAHSQEDGCDGDRAPRASETSGSADERVSAPPRTAPRFVPRGLLGRHAALQTKQLRP